MQITHKINMYVTGHYKWPLCFLSNKNCNRILRHAHYDVATEVKIFIDSVFDFFQILLELLHTS